MDWARIWVNYVGDDISKTIRVRGNIGCAVGWMTKDDTQLENRNWVQPIGLPGIYADNVATGVRLDDIIPDTITEIPFLKIDTEGGEYNVLRGGMKLLRKKIIKNMYIEISPPFEKEHGLTTGQLAELMMEIMAIGYNYFPVQLPDGLPIPGGRMNTRFGNYPMVKRDATKAELVALYDAMRSRVTGMNAWFTLGDLYV